MQVLGKEDARACQLLAHNGDGQYASTSSTVLDAIRPQKGCTRASSRTQGYQHCQTSKKSEIRCTPVAVTCHRHSYFAASLGMHCTMTYHNAKPVPVYHSCVLQRTEPHRKHNTNVRRYQLQEQMCTDKQRRWRVNQE